MENSVNNTEILDVLIIGSGPAGLSAAIYAKRAGLNVLISEKEFMGTGQIANSSRVDNYLGIPAISGFDLGEAFRNHTESLGVEIQDVEVIKITPPSEEENVWVTEFEDGSKRFSKTIIYAAGCSHRHLGVAMEEKYEGKGISYCAVCDGAFYKDKNVVVAGGGNTALDDALYLSDICANVYLIHRRNEFRGAASTLEKLKGLSNVHIITGVNVKELLGDKKLEGIVLDNGQKIDASGLFVAVGMKPATDLLKGIVEMNDAGYVVAGEDCVTSKEGLYIAGDARTKELRQVITAASDGANAASQAVKYIKR